MKRILVCGAGGFIATHLIKRLKADGHEVVGIGRQVSEFEKSEANTFYLLDLKRMKPADPLFEGFDEVYQLAAEVGGLGYIMNRSNDAQVLSNNMRVNLNVLEACRFHKIPKVFFASSACVYPSFTIDAVRLTHTWRGLETEISGGCKEADAYPAQCDNSYAWEKLFAEQLYLAYANCYPDLQVRIGRFHNTFGGLGTWRGGREKAPAAICRKVAEAKDGGEIEIWGDGKQTRSFLHVEHTVEGMIRLMAHPTFRGPVNIGSSELVTVNQLVDAVCEIADKSLRKKYVNAPEGVRGRNSDNSLLWERLGWMPPADMKPGLIKTYQWIEQQVQQARLTEPAE